MIRFATVLAAALMLAPTVAPQPPVGPATPPRNPFVVDGIDVAFAMPDVDVELMLMADVSGSMDPVDLRQQRAGYLAALRSPQVAAAVVSGGLGRIALAYAEFAGVTEPVMVVPWVTIEGAAGLADFAARLAAEPDRHPSLATGVAAYGTAVGPAIAFGHAQVLGNGIIGERAVVDVSGDGRDRYSTLDAAVARDAAVAGGITINGLPILSATGEEDLEGWYRDHVIGGPGAFLVAVDGLGQFGEAVRRKLVLEIAARPVEQWFVGLRP